MLEPWTTILRRISVWLETHWANPAYAGWLLGGLSLFFLAAAVNTMAGWLYAISGLILALLAIAALLPSRILQSIQVARQPIQPISAGEVLSLELTLHNPTQRPKTLVQVEDRLPAALGTPICKSIETIPPQDTYIWTYEHPTQRRGIYRWATVFLRTAAPLGLFWCGRSHSIKAVAIVYPTVLPLVRCPILDETGQDIHPQFYSRYHSQTTNEGVTRTLRPYRWGDSRRLVHWRTSARYGELRVRELEDFTGGQEVILCLDTRPVWQPEHFEQAVIAAASLYFYAVKRNLVTSLWTAATGRVQGDRSVLETLAAIDLSTEAAIAQPPRSPLLWLTQASDSLNALPEGSRWLLWSTTGIAIPTGMVGLAIDPERPLQSQLQVAVSPNS